VADMALIKGSLKELFIGMSLMIVIINLIAIK
jgi:hypothetical protein